MRSPLTTDLSTVKSTPVSWLWPGRIPRGKVTLLCGDPGLGKSFVTMDMAARVTSHQDWPDAPTPLKQPGSVLVLSAEDDPSDTIRPRIEAAGGDPSRVLVLEGVKREGGGGSKGISLTVDIDMIEQALASMERPRLVIIDPISAYMGDADSHNNTEVRGILAELSRLAGKLGPAIVCVTHLNKAPGGKAVYRAMGSLAFTAAARIAWQIAKMPGDEEKRAMVLVKSNLPDVGKGLAFRLSQDENRNGFVQWLDTSLEISADFMEEGAPGEGDAVPEACAFLRSTLAAGPRPAQEVIADAEKNGIPLASLKRAKRLAGVRSWRGSGGRDRPWVWGVGGVGGGIEAQGSGAEGEPLLARDLVATGKEVADVSSGT